MGQKSHQRGCRAPRSVRARAVRSGCAPWSGSRPRPAAPCPRQGGSGTGGNSSGQRRRKEPLPAPCEHPHAPHKPPPCATRGRNNPRISPVETRGLRPLGALRCPLSAGKPQRQTPPQAGCGATEQLVLRHASLSVSVIKYKSWGNVMHPYTQEIKLNVIAPSLSYFT